MKATCIAILVVVASIAAEGEALACRCIGSPTSFEQAVAEAPVVLVGRVSSIGSFRVPTRGGFDPPVVELEVISVAKGALDKTRERVDVWNPSAGSSCGGALRSIEVGSQVVFALRRAQSGHVAPEPVLRRTGVRDPAEAVLILLAGWCGAAHKVLQGQPDLDRWVGRRIR